MILGTSIAHDREAAPKPAWVDLGRNRLDESPQSLDRGLSRDQLVVVQRPSDDRENDQGPVSVTGPHNCLDSVDHRPDRVEAPCLNRIAVARLELEHKHFRCLVLHVQNLAAGHRGEALGLSSRLPGQIVSAARGTMSDAPDSPGSSNPNSTCCKIACGPRNAIVSTVWR